MNPNKTISLRFMINWDIQQSYSH